MKEIIQNKEKGFIWLEIIFGLIIVGLIGFLLWYNRDSIMSILNIVKENSPVK